MAGITARPGPSAWWRAVVRTTLRPSEGVAPPAPLGPVAGHRWIWWASASLSGRAVPDRATSTGRPDGPPLPANPGLALAQAVREELTRPGSVPARRQFELIMAEHEHGGGRTPGASGGPHRGWTPFLASVDPCPYRTLAAGSWLLSTPTVPATEFSRPAG